MALCLQTEHPMMDCKTILKTSNFAKLSLITLIISAVSLGCSNSSGTASPAPSSSQAPGSAPLIVTILPGSGGATPTYSPNPAKITVGRSIQWANQDTVAHSATSDTGAFDTGTIQPQATSSPVPFPSIGTFTYYSSETTSLTGVVQVTPSPSPSPSGSGTPSPSPSPSSSPRGWSQVYIQRICPYPQCAGTSGFTVNSNGSYSSGDGPTGNISPSELTILNNAAIAVAANEGASFSCVQQSSLPGELTATVNETFSDGTSQQIYSRDTASNSLCFRGSQQSAQALFQVMNALAIRYDVTATPSPSPSPSASPSPTASPSAASIR